MEELVAYGEGNETVPMPAIEVEVAIEEFLLEATPRRRTLTETINEVAWSLLERQHGGWENDDGGFGEIVFDTAERAITLEMNERYTASNHHEYRF